VVNIFGNDVGRDRLTGWYCNIVRPAHITGEHVSTDDLALDLFVAPDGAVTVLDEDEFATLPLDAATRAQRCRRPGRSAPPRKTAARLRRHRPDPPLVALHQPRPRPGERIAREAILPAAAAEGHTRQRGIIKSVEARAWFRAGWPSEHHTAQHREQHHDGIVLISPHTARDGRAGQNVAATAHRRRQAGRRAGGAPAR
jgi:hypothetical protein